MFNTKIPATTPDTFTADITAAPVTVVDMWAPWCAPCKAIAPQFEKLSEKYPDVKFFGLNAEEHRDFIQAQGVGTVPTVRIYRDGQQVAQFHGPAAAMQLAGFLQKL